MHAHTKNAKRYSQFKFKRFGIYWYGFFEQTLYGLQFFKYEIYSMQLQEPKTADVLFSICKNRKLRFSRLRYTVYLIQNNFNGIRTFNVNFNDSDLYNSRFMFSALEQTLFQNCNITKTIFAAAAEKDVSYKSSNTREAVFDIGRGVAE